MKAILFISALFILNACSLFNKEPCPDKIEYIKQQCPNIRLLPKLKKTGMTKKIKVYFEKTDDPNKVIVTIDDLKKGSYNSQRKTIFINKQSRYIIFYENELRELQKFCQKK